MYLGTNEVLGGELTTKFSILVLKGKKLRVVFSWGGFSKDCFGTLYQNCYKPQLWTYEKLYCKVEPCRFSDKRDSSVHKS